MLLTKLSYSEHHGTSKYWEIQDIMLGKISIIVGKNATGKTRMMRVLKNLAYQICGKMQQLFDGKFDLTFVKSDQTRYQYYLYTLKQEVVEEYFYINDQLVLDRSKNKAEISDGEGNRKPYFPPPDKLTLQVRRDQKEYPYLEDLFAWAANYNAYMFGTCDPKSFVVSIHNTKEEIPFESLEAAPQILEKLLAEQSQSIEQDMIQVGYPTKKIAVSRALTSIGTPITLAILQEDDLLCATIQPDMSSGMYRALAMVIVVRYLLSQKKSCTLAVDDIGEGLDFDRASRLIQWILKNTKDSDIQIIFTSNDRHLLNAVDTIYWNILERHQSKIVSYNYQNSKQAFDDFAMTGLSNFDFLSGEMYKETKPE